MMTMNLLRCLVIFVMSAAAVYTAGGEPLHVLVSVSPHAYLVERIGGSGVSVEVLLKQGQDPHTFEPAPKQIVAAGKTRLFFKAGFPFERRVLEKLSDTNKKLELIDTGAGVTRRKMEDDLYGEDSHGREDGQETGLDPHIWLAVKPLKIQAGNIAKALTQADPASGAEYTANLETLNAELDGTYRFLSEKLEPFKGSSFFVFHPSFGYFADEYGLHQEAVETGGKAPSMRQTAGLIKKARSKNVRVIFVQPQFDPRGAEAIASAIGGVVVPMDPLAKDLVGNLKAIGLAIGQSVQEAKDSNGNGE